MRRIGFVLWLLMLPTLTWATLPAGEQWREQIIGNFGGIDRRVGYGRLATGGAGGTLCTVSNLNDSGAGSLRSCLESSGPIWVIFSVSGNIMLNTRIATDGGPGRGDKTIDGRGQNITITGATTDGQPPFFISGVSNWIIHDVSFRTSPPGAFIIRVLCSKTIWFDHIDIAGAGDNVVSLGIGAYGGTCTPDPATDYSDAVTISWSKFHDRCWLFGGTLCGSGMVVFGQNNHIEPPVEFGMYNATLTMHHNWYQQSAHVRIPFMRYGRVHSFNNYQDNIDQGVIVQENGRFNSENDIFQCDAYGGGTIPALQCGFSGAPQRVRCTNWPGGQYDADNCKVTNPWLVTGTETYEQVSPGTTFNPASDYSYTLDTANAALRSALTNTTTGAGAVSNPYNYLAVSTDAQVGWWKLDASSGTTAVDSSGNALDGTLVNMESPGDWVQGLIGNVAGKGALQFDGTNEYVTIPDSDLLSPVTTGQFSICAWARLPSAPTDFATIVAKGTSGNYEYAFDLDTAQHVVFVLWPASGSPSHATVTSSTTVPLNSWMHVCGTYENAVAVNVYLNAINGGTSSSFTGVMTNGTSPVNIGRRPDAIEYLNGRVDDVRIFNYALTQPEIAAIMAEGFDVVYHLDEVASPSNDSGQPGIYDGTWVASPTPVIPGKLNNALSFNGSNQYVSVATSPSLVGAASVAMWVKMSALTGAHTLISNADASNANTQVGFNIDGGNGSWNYLYTLGSVTRGFMSDVGKITTGNWIHLAATDDGAGNVQLYQAGSPITTTPFGTVTAKPGLPPGIFALARAGGASIQYTNGAVDEVHLVSRVMSAGEIAALAAEGGDVLAPAAPTNLRVVSP